MSEATDDDEIERRLDEAREDAIDALYLKALLRRTMTTRNPAHHEIAKSTVLWLEREGAIHPDSRKRKREAEALADPIRRELLQALKDVTDHEYMREQVADCVMPIILRVKETGA